MNQSKLTNDEKLAQAEQAQEQEQAYIKALAKLDLEKKELQAELAQVKQDLELVQADSREFRDERNELQELAESQAEKLVHLEATCKSLTIAFDKADEKLAKQVQELAYANKIVSQAEQAEKLAKQALDNTESLLWDTQAELNKVKQELEAQAKQAKQAELASLQALASPQEQELEQELAYYKLEQAWGEGLALASGDLAKLCKLRKKYNSVTPEKQAEQSQELDLSWD